MADSGNIWFHKSQILKMSIPKSNRIPRNCGLEQIWNIHIIPTKDNMSKITLKLFGILHLPFQRRLVITKLNINFTPACKIHTAQQAQHLPCDRQTRVPPSHRVWKSISFSRYQVAVTKTSSITTVCARLRNSLRAMTSSKYEHKATLTRYPITGARLVDAVNTEEVLRLDNRIKKTNRVNEYFWWRQRARKV